MARIKIDQVEVARALREMRKKIGLNRKELCRQFSTADGIVSAIEGGKAAKIGFTLGARIQRFWELNADADYRNFTLFHPFVTEEMKRFVRDLFDQALSGLLCLKIHRKFRNAKVQVIIKISAEDLEPEIVTLTSNQIHVPFELPQPKLCGWHKKRQIIDGVQETAGPVGNLEWEGTK